MIVYWTKYSPRQKIKILGPDVNCSYYQFEVERKNIRVGLTSIKGLALKTAEKVIEERKNGEYLSVEDFLCRFMEVDIAVFPMIFSFQAIRM